MTSILVFKARVDSLAGHVTVRHLLTYWRPAWHPSLFNPCTCVEHWWRSSPGSSMLLPHRMWQNRHSTDWGIFTNLCEIVKLIQEFCLCCEYHQWTVKIWYHAGKFHSSSLPKEMYFILNVVFGCVLSPLNRKKIKHTIRISWLLSENKFLLQNYLNYRITFLSSGC